MIECYPGNKLPLFCASLVLVGSDIFNFLYNFAIIITLSNPIRWLFKLAFLFHWLMNLILLKSFQENLFLHQDVQVVTKSLKKPWSITFLPQVFKQSSLKEEISWRENIYLVTSRCIAASTAIIFITLSE